MAKARKPKKEKKDRAHKYEEKLKISGSFQDLLNELVPPAKTPKNKKE